ncbi:MAG: cell division protein ZapA [Gammaproteobacteria bacterium]
MTPNPIPVTLMIMGKEYKIACSADERDDLLKAALQLDLQMRQIRDSGKVIGPERIAVMAALNLTHDLNQLQHQNMALSNGINERLTVLRHKVENALNTA